MKLSCRIVHVEHIPVYLGKDSLNLLDKLITTARPPFDKLFVLTDETTAEWCLPVLQTSTVTLANFHHLSVPAGELSKSTENAVNLWMKMAAAGATRNSLLVNLGGGVISDLGGFVAAGYQRGIRYVNIPTSLIGQVDASVGGKTGINLEMIKNQVGFFYNPLAVFIHAGFLKTLPPRHFRSGFAEIVKSVLTGDGRLWKRLQARDVDGLLAVSPLHHFLEELIRFSVTYKVRIVREDYREKRLRKVLNFGHTAGHAFETWSNLVMPEPLLHGEAVAAGMLVAALLSIRKAGLPVSEFAAITDFILKCFPISGLSTHPVEEVMAIMVHDKKRRSDNIEFTLIRKPGEALLQVPCTESEITAALKTVRNIAAEQSSSKAGMNASSKKGNERPSTTGHATDPERASS